MFNEIGPVLDWLYAKQKSKRKNNNYLKCIKEYFPSFSFPMIHIAGTNGKGSTTNYLRSIFQCAGYKVGSFTSPHLIQHNDRIRINNIPISDEDFIRYVNEYYDVFEINDLSMFEIDFFIAMKYFTDQKIDYAMIEVGLGGIKDPTNVIDPIVSVITTIDYDHMNYLGNSIEEIAFNKAGIIKENRPVVTHAKRKEAIKVIAQKAKQEQSQLIILGDIEYRKKSNQLFFDLYDWKDLMIEDAIYQIDNAANSVAVIKICKDMGINIPDEAIYQGLQTKWLGRFEKVSQKPLVYIDGAHNIEGIKALKETIISMNLPCQILFAALKDKSIDQMMDELLSISDDITITTFDNYRIWDIDEVAKKYPVKKEKDYQKALKDMLNKDMPLTIITGSLYFISEVRKWFYNKY